MRFLLFAILMAASTTAYATDATAPDVEMHVDEEGVDFFIVGTEEVVDVAVRMRPLRRADVTESAAFARSLGGTAARVSRGRYTAFRVDLILEYVSPHDIESVRRHMQRFYVNCVPATAQCVLVDHTSYLLANGLADYVWDSDHEEFILVQSAEGGAR